MDTDRTIIVISVGLSWFALTFIWHWFRSKSLLQEWAKKNGLVLIKMNLNLFNFRIFSPFLFVSKHQEVLRIRVRDHNGRERNGWAKCGGFWLGFLVNKVEVEWD